MSFGWAGAKECGADGRTLSTVYGESEDGGKRPAYARVYAAVAQVEELHAQATPTSNTANLAVRIDIERC